MPAPFIVPFNNQPVNTGVTTASYTVPAGKYSRVIVTVGLTASVSKSPVASATTGAAAQAGSYTANQGSFNDKLELWLKAGDVLSFTTSVASGAVSATSITTVASGVYFRATSSSTQTTISLNASALATFYATAQIGFYYVPQTTVVSTAVDIGTFTGAASVVTHFEEFNVIS